jgi:hypothetical protein
MDWKEARLGKEITKADIVMIQAEDDDRLS